MVFFGKVDIPRRNSCHSVDLIGRFPLTGDKISSCHTRKKYEILDLGLMHPEEEPTDSLQPGQVGYIACNMKESSEGKPFVVIHANLIQKSV